MKKIYLILFACSAFFGTKATTYTVTASNFMYTPSTLTISVGDVVQFVGMAGGHPTAQVDATNWAANNATPLGGGWGVMSANFTYTATTAGTIYYICQFHASSGMKGKITVAGVGVNETSSLVLNNFSLFPNPAQNNVSVSFALIGTSNVSVKLFNAIGQEVKTLTPTTNLPEGNYNYSYEIPAVLATGNYFVEVRSNDRMVTKKLIINK